uniref:Hexosyltransferase n=1 Tax=Arion vulgaris TaxID=1028688 RepID=A0A0B6Y861_9EUPU
MGLLIKRLPYRERHLTRRAFIFMAGGVLLSLVFLAFLLLCQLPCAENQYSYEYEQWKRGRSFLTPSKYSRYTLVILIISGPDNLNERNTIRQTWLTGIDDSFVLFRFVVGTAALDKEKAIQLTREDATNKDMVLLNNVKDSYNELTFKVLQALVWLDKHAEYQYVLKVDDDSFVFVSGVLLELQFKPKERLYWGFFDGRANVKTLGKWKETNWNLCDKYLPYARGGGYVLSFDLVNFIARNSDLLQLYLSEDVSVGAWLAPLKVNRHHDQNFDTEYMSRGCLNTYLVLHKQSAVSLRELQDNLETLGVLCKTETVLRGSYEYNWTYPPSQCCNRALVQQKGAKKKKSEIIKNI